MKIKRNDYNFICNVCNFYNIQLYKDKTTGDKATAYYLTKTKQVANIEQIMANYSNYYKIIKFYKEYAPEQTGTIFLLYDITEKTYKKHATRGTK